MKIILAGAKENSGFSKRIGGLNVMKGFLRTQELKSSRLVIITTDNILSVILHCPLCFG